MYNHSKLRQIGWTLPLLGYLFFTHVTAATTYYVSTTGKANSTGTKERPTNSLQSALEQIERQSGQGSTTDFHIVIQPGTYRIEKAICIGPQHVPHGGSLTIKAETPGTVDISGARAISEWKQTDQRNVWTAKDQVTTPRQGAARQLFLAEKRGIRAREPDRGFFASKERAKIGANPLRPMIRRGGIAGPYRLNMRPTSKSHFSTTGQCHASGSRVWKTKR